MAFTFLSYSTRTMLVSSLPDKAVKEYFIEQIHKLTEESGIVNTQITESSYAFDAPITRWSWNGFNLFNLISRAEMKFDKPGHVLYFQYKFWFTELIVLALVLTTLPVLAFFQGLNEYAIGLLLGVWLVIYGGGVAFAIMRFSKWMQKSIDRIEYHLAEEAGDMPPAEVLETN